jgi:signal transduction histidine kinase/CheY-like chemotaxis protein
MKRIDNEKSPFLKKIGAGAVLAVITAAIVLLTFRAYSSVQTQLFSERSSHLNEITSKISVIINTIVESTKKMSASAANLLENEDDGCTVTEFLAEANDTLETDEDTLIFAFTSEGEAYSSVGHSIFRSSTDILASKDESRIVIDTMPFDSSEYMIFYHRLDNAKTLDGKTFTHVAVAQKLSAISSSLAVTGFDDNFFLYIINESGTRIYRSSESDSPYDGYNVLTAMKDLEYLHGSSYSDLLSAVSSRTTQSYEYKTGEGESYFVAVTPLSTNNWLILSYVPTSVLGKNSENVISVLVLYLVFISAFVVIFCGASMFFALSSRTDRQLLLHQKESNAALEEAVKRADEANKAKSEFLSHMSHDIRTPINGVMGMTEIAMRNLGNTEKTEYCLKKIDESSHHLLSLVNDVLDMSRIESGKTVISHDAMDLRTVLDNCSSIIGGQLMQRDVELVEDFDSITHPGIFGDELHLRQVLINILGNAVKFTPDGGKIYFRAKETAFEDNKVSFTFEIEDTGIGMKPEFMAHIWDAFSQEHSGSRTEYKGTGLGMTITKKFVEMMGGTIEVESEFQKGTKFTVKLTCDNNEDAYKEEAPEQGVTRLDGMRVLLVEDNALNAEIAQILLEEAGITVTVAENGQIALDSFRDNPPDTYDVILMDIMMPVMNGLEATRAIRQVDRPDAAKIPILAMTANAYDEDVKKALDAGMNAHFSKPLNIQLLLGALSVYRRQC